MRTLILIGLTASLAAPYGVWTLVENTAPPRPFAEVIGEDLIRCQAPSGKLHVMIEQALALHCGAGPAQGFPPPGTPFDEDQEYECQRRIWSARDRHFCPTVYVASRTTQTAVDTRGHEWRVETILSDGAPALVFISTDASEGAGILTNRIAALIELELDLDRG